jgi:hypothetical protein
MNSYIVLGIKNRVADPYHCGSGYFLSLNMDPDPTFHFNAVPFRIWFLLFSKVIRIHNPA